MSQAKKPPSPRLPCTGHQREVKEGLSKDHMVMDGGERNATNGKDLEQHFSHGKGPAEVDTCHPV